MSLSCCVAVCPNSEIGTADQPEDVSYHSFPIADAGLRAKWLAFMGADPAEFRWQSKYICSAHFLPSELLQTCGKSFLLDGAVPGINGPVVVKSEAADVLEEEVATITDDNQGTVPLVKIEPLEIIELRTQFCRICIMKAQDMVPLDSKLHDNSLVNVIHIISGLRIIPSEHLPTMVCSECIENINVAYNVYIRINKYANILNEMIECGQLENHYKLYDAVKYGEVIGCVENYNAEWIKITTDNAIVEEILPEQSVEVSIEEHSTRKELPQSDTAIQVYSWKELYKPKAKPRHRVDYKICNTNLPSKKLDPNTCYVCTTPHQNQEALNEHSAIHALQIPFTCSTCHCDEYPAVFKSFSTLNDHMKRHLYHYKCDHCWYRTRTYGTYQNHIREFHAAPLVHGELTCKICGLTKATRTKLNKHVRTHSDSNEARFKCKHCEKTCKKLELLTEHERIHTGEQPFQCTKCGRRFNKKVNLRVHLRRHTGEKPHVCQECGKAFVEAAQLRYHMAVHFPDDPRYRKKSKKKAE